jgi:hypothetical protein
MLYHVWISIRASKSASRAFCTILDDLSLSMAGSAHISTCFRAARQRKGWTFGRELPAEELLASAIIDLA